MALVSNYKNDLQIYFQKAGQPLPRYEMIDHQPYGQNGHLFISQVILPDKKVFRGEGFTKKASEMVAAKEACEYYLTTNENENATSISSEGQIYQRPESPRYIFLVDLENLPKALDYGFPLDSYVMGFAGNLSSQYKNCENYNKNRALCDFRVIDSAVKDAADIALIFECGILSMTYPNLPFFIVSSDHYAQPLLNLLQSHNQENHHKITCLRDLQTVLTKLKTNEK